MEVGVSNKTGYSPYWYDLSGFIKLGGQYAVLLQVFKNSCCGAERINAGWFVDNTKHKVQARIDKSILFLKKKYHGIMDIKEIIEEERQLLSLIEKMNHDRPI